MSTIARVKQRFLALRVFVFASLAVSLLFLDQHHESHVAAVRHAVVRVASPLQQVATMPVKFWREWVQSFSARDAILAENEKLKTQILMLQAENQRVLALQADNEELASLLNSTQILKNHFSAATVISAGTSAFGQQEVLSKGSDDQVYDGQAVIDASGLLGQVVEVFPKTSSVMLVTDPRSAVPVQIVRNGQRAIVMGGGEQGLQLVNMAPLADVQEGDQLVTSGMGGRFPSGVPVGVVQRVEKVEGQQFLTIPVEPIAKLRTSKQVLLVWKGDENA